MTDAKSDGPAEESGFPLSGEAIDGFAGRSAALGRILGGGEATNIVAAYGREDKRAIEEQIRFSSVATRLNRTVLATAVIGAVILALGVLQPWLQQNVDPRFDQLIVWPRFDQVVSWVVAALGFFGLLVGGYAAALLYELNAGDLERDWMQGRARAEQLRSEYFDRLVAHAATADSATQDATLRPRHQAPASKINSTTSLSVANAMRGPQGIGCDWRPLPPASPRSASPRAAW